MTEFEGASQIPPRNGEGDQVKLGGGVPRILHAPIKSVKIARRLRKDMSLPEVLLWQQLQKRPGGFRFRRQFPIAPYILDFVCLEARVGIEIDGEAHNRGNKPQCDVARDSALSEQGLLMLRIPAREVLGNMDGCVRAIVAACTDRGPLHQLAAGPPPRTGEEFA